ncbi:MULTISPECIES: hypothetical protein [Klebsiella]|uniref:hypothetical protein n=1 Tax=Klebsiella TaxID=570 RepID=UPI001157D3D8|nr:MULTISPECIES: hypothetical protein [Klebsiella]EHC3600379.1 hypothetical protein [Salmonella enterica subsp. enterica serovar Enteritidis]MBU9997306.1 hypothetical protein [Klebsiella michiganensis]
MTDITELALKEKFEAWARSQQLSIAYGDCGYVFSSTEMAWRAWKAASAELVEALEKAQQERENWRTSFDNERFRADKLKAHIDEMTEERTASINELSRIIQKEVKAKREAEKRIAELESRTVKLPKPISVLYRRDSTDAHRAIYAYPEAEVNAALDESGIKWEAE